MFLTDQSAYCLILNINYSIFYGNFLGSRMMLVWYSRFTMRKYTEEWTM